jgi:hypothetical protein
MGLGIYISLCQNMASMISHFLVDSCELLLTKYFGCSHFFSQNWCNFYNKNTFNIWKQKFCQGSFMRLILSYSLPHIIEW